MYQQISLSVKGKWPGEPLQLLEKFPLLIPSRMERDELGRSRVMSMKHKDIILHPVNLSEGNLIITQTQVRRKVVKVIGRLDPISEG